MKPPAFIRGIGYLLTGLKLLTTPTLRRFVLAPLLVSTLLFVSGSWFALGHILAWSAWLNAFLPSWLQWMEWILVPLLFGSVGILFFTSLGIVANLIGAPFNALLAQQVEIHLAGTFDTAHHPQPQGLWQSVFPTVHSEIQKILYYIIRAIPLLLLFVLPVVNVAAPFIWMFFTSWMNAFQYADFPMGNHQLNDKQILARLREERLLSLGFGAATLLLTLVPVVNVLAMPAAVAGATAMWVEEWRGK
ncbi:Sulfate transporter CysZ [Candidatus Magnetaquicoccaceae bacterium FCR-1]|uniref:Sulfate transporter CysZ n=1 Tax=Candidatus Magnetaquiglobus chichijimensis TaxID=3141448 RepID=A0ABQ0C702_9PROT